MLIIRTTIRRRGHDPRHIFGLYASTAAAIVSTLDTLGDSLSGARISAEVVS